MERKAFVQYTIVAAKKRKNMTKLAVEEILVQRLRPLIEAIWALDKVSFSPLLSMRTSLNIWTEVPAKITARTRDDISQDFGRYSQRTTDL
jgi:hypothetical protein